jgi:hypothetical protein
MRQLLRILLVSFSITAVESGILYLLMAQEEKKEPKIFLADPQVTQVADAVNSSYALRQPRRKVVPDLNVYRHHLNGQPQPNLPRSDGRVYRR